MDTFELCFDMFDLIVNSRMSIGSSMMIYENMRYLYLLKDFGSLMISKRTLCSCRLREEQEAEYEAR